MNIEVGMRLNQPYRCCHRLAPAATGSSLLFHAPGHGSCHTSRRRRPNHLPALPVALVLLWGGMTVANATHDLALVQQPEPSKGGCRREEQTYKASELLNQKISDHSQRQEHTFCLAQAGLTTPGRCVWLVAG
jgi:hypothetical protein